MWPHEEWCFCDSAGAPVRGAGQGRQQVHRRDPQGRKEEERQQAAQGGQTHPGSHGPHDPNPIFMGWYSERLPELKQDKGVSVLLGRALASLGLDSSTVCSVRPSQLRRPAGALASVRAATTSSSTSPKLSRCNNYVSLGESASLTFNKAISTQKPMGHICCTEEHCSDTALSTVEQGTSPAHRSREGEFRKAQHGHAPWLDFVGIHPILIPCWRFLPLLFLSPRCTKHWIFPMQSVLLYSQFRLSWKEYTILWYRF